jgi:hypothetical protein
MHGATIACSLAEWDTGLVEIDDAIAVARAVSSQSDYARA